MASSFEITLEEIEAILAGEPYKRPEKSVPSPAEETISSELPMNQAEAETLIAATESVQNVQPEVLPSDAMFAGTEEDDGMSQAEIEAMLSGTDIVPDPSAALEFNATMEEDTDGMNQAESEAMQMDRNSNESESEESESAEGPMSEEEVQEFLRAIGKTPEEEETPQEISQAEMPQAELTDGVFPDNSSDDGISQEDLSGIMAAINEEVSDALQPDPILVNADKPMSQEDFEAYLATMNSKEEESELQEPVTSPVDGEELMSQAESESMRMTVPEPLGKDSEPDTAQKPAETSDTSISQNEIEALMAAMAAAEPPVVEPPPPPPPVTTEPADMEAKKETVVTTQPAIEPPPQVAPEPQPEPASQTLEKAGGNLEGQALKAVKPARMGLDERWKQFVAGFTLPKFGIKKTAKAETAVESQSTGEEEVKDANGIGMVNDWFGSKKILAGVAFILVPLLLVTIIYLGMPAFQSALQGNFLQTISPEQKLEGMGIAFEADDFVKYAGRGNKEVTELFLQGGMSPNVYRSSDGVTPLMTAALFGRLEIVDLLLQNGAKVNMRDKDEQTALMKAVFYNQIDVIKTLLQAKADISSRDLHGNTVISLALEKKDPQVLNMLTQAGATGIPDALAKMRAAAKAKTSKEAKEAAGEKEPEKPKIPPEYLLVSGKAGFAQVGRPVETLYRNYPKSAIMYDTDYTEGRQYPIVKVVMPGEGKPSMILSLNISKQGQQQTIDGIQVYDARFKTPSGVGINSTLGDLRKGEGIGNVKYIGDTVYVVTPDGKMLFEIDLSVGNMPTEFLKSGDARALPDGMKIRGIIMQ